MADPQDRPDSESDAAPTPPPPPSPPAARVDKAPEKAVKKTPAKKAPAKEAEKKAAKAPAKKAPAKKAPAKKAPAKVAPANAADQPLIAPRIDTNGQLATAAKEAAAQAKSTVAAADNPVTPDVPSLAPAGRSPVPLAVAIAISLLALLLVRQMRRRFADED